MMAKRELDKRLRDVSFTGDGTDTEEASVLAQDGRRADAGRRQVHEGVGVRARG